MAGQPTFQLDPLSTSSSQVSSPQDISTGHNRCVRCRCARRNSTCEHQVLQPIVTGNDYDFWNWTVFHEFCRSMKQSQSYDAYLLGSLNIFFRDRLLQAEPHGYGVNIRPSEGHGENELISAKTVDLRQLDQIASLALWCSLWTNDDNSRRSSGEKYFWSLIQLACGYLSLLENLNTTFIQTTGSVASSYHESIAIQYVYSCGHQLQSCVAILFWWLPQLDCPEKFGIKPAVVLYGVDVLYLCLKSMFGTEWHVPERSPVHPFMGIADLFKSRKDRALEKLINLDAQICRAYGSNRRLPELPSFLEFAHGLALYKTSDCGRRSIAKTDVRCFPRYCNIVFSRNFVNKVLDLEFLDNQSSHYTISEILGQSSTLGVRHRPPTTDRMFRAPEHYVTQRNTLRDAANISDRECPSQYVFIASDDNLDRAPGLDLQMAMDWITRLQNDSVTNVET